MDKQREQFEAIANAPLERHPIYADQYENVRTQDLWNLWQAALSTQHSAPTGEVELPVVKTWHDRMMDFDGDGDPQIQCMYEEIDDLRAALRAYGQRAEFDVAALLKLLSEQKAEASARDGDWWRGYGAALHWISKTVSEGDKDA